MILLLHIVIALSSMVFSGMSFFSPSRRKIHTTYALIIGTIASGTVLVMQSPSHLASACLTGIIYVGFVMSGVLAARRRLAKAESAVSSQE